VVVSGFSDAQVRAWGYRSGWGLRECETRVVARVHTTGSVSTLKELSGSLPSAPTVVVDASVSGTAGHVACGWEADGADRRSGRRGRAGHTSAGGLRRHGHRDWRAMCIPIPVPLPLGRTHQHV
jgi:hypothetical protein